MTKITITKILKVDVSTKGTKSHVQIQPTCRSKYDRQLINSFIVDYNSWQESDKSRALLQSLANERDLVLAEGYREYDTGRTYMAQMGDWRNNKDEEIELDGIGGVSILVKADVHRAGIFPSSPLISSFSSPPVFPCSVLPLLKTLQRKQSNALY